MLDINEIYHERIDDLPVIIGVCQQLNLVEAVNQHIGTHGLQEGLTNGQLCIGWLGYILSQGNHNKVSVDEWSGHRAHSLGRLLGKPLRSGEFGDDRLGRLLKRLSHDDNWNALESSLWRATLLVHEMELQGIRLDSTTSYGHHQVTETGIMQLGHSKDHRPDLPQLKLMAAAAEPSGHLIASDLYAGNKADDPLYTPLIRRVRDLLGRRGLLYSGDCKMSALETRVEIQQAGDFYLTPLALTGKQKECFEQWVTTLAVEGKQPAQLLWDNKTLIGAGYEFERQQSSPSSGLDWCERVLLVRSLTLAQVQQRGLQERLRAATEALLALTPAPGRGKRQIRTLEQLNQMIEQVVKQYGVAQLLKVSWSVQQTTHKRYQGRGRGSPSRPVIETVTTRYVITSVETVAEQIAETSYRLGWRALLTNAPSEALSLTQAVLHYRGGWSLERDFHLLKDRPLGLSPLFVYKDDQIKGLTRLLTIALRLVTLMELQVHHAIQVNNAELIGLYEGQPNRRSKRPSARRILMAFTRAEITLTRIDLNQESYWRITPLSPLLKMLLGYLALPESLFTLDNSS